MKVSRQLGDVTTALTNAGWPEVEVYRKQGRSRRLEHSSEGRTAVFTQEEGWAVRAGDARRSFFATGTGGPEPDGPWPEADGGGLRLPASGPVAPWIPPSDLETSLMGENEGHSFLDALARCLEEELPGAILSSAVFEDGSSEVELRSSHGIEARYRNRVASLRLEATLPGERDSQTSLQLAERQARSFNPRGLAQSLANRLVVAARGRAAQRDRGEMLLAPEVGSHLLWGLAPFLQGRKSRARLESLRDRRGKLASAAWTLIDDGRLRGGVLEAPVDGEGVGTGKTVLMEEGVLGRPLLPWWEVSPSKSRPPGCRLRAGWRHLPQTGPTHLYLKPDPRVGVNALLSEVARGYYFIGTAGRGLFDMEEGRFSMPVFGFAVHRGQAAGPVAGAWLCGGIRALLHGVQAAGRDLSFLPLRGMVGSPSLLVTGLEVRGA